MKSKIPTDAFDRYVAMGESRSYQAMAEVVGVSKCAIAKCAKREGWPERLAKIKADAREISDRKLTESISDMQARHMKLVKIIAARALEGLREMPIASGMDAVKAADLAIKLERLLAGEATARTERTVEEVTRHEVHTLLERVPAKPEPVLVEAVSNASHAEADQNE